MTEQEWLEGADLYDMLMFVGNNVGVRKLRLFNRACYYRIRPLLPDDRCRKIVEALDQHATGTCLCDSWHQKTYDVCPSGIDEMEEALKEHTNSRDGVLGDTDQRFGLLDDDRPPLPETVACYATLAVRWAVYSISKTTCGSVAYWAASARRLASGLHEVQEQEYLVQRNLFRCILGPLFFRHVKIDPDWFTENVLGIAASIFENERFADMPILADALEDAGCVNADILTHCRSGGEHVRGCWLIDLLLGKS